MKLLLVLLLATACAASGYSGYNQFQYYYPGLGQYDGLKQYDSYLVGRQGIGFDQRTAKAYGFRQPLTAYLTQVLRRYPEKL